MKSRTCMMMGLLMALPVLALAHEQTGSRSTAPIAQAKHAFDLKAAGVRAAIRANAVSPTAVKNDDGANTGADLPALKFRAPRRVHHVDCDSFNCVAYTADDDALFSVPRDQYFGVTGNGSTRDSWLACQSGDDLLTTFERYDKCRGVSVGIPVQFRDVTVNVPVLGR